MRSTTLITADLCFYTLAAAQAWCQAKRDAGWAPELFDMGNGTFRCVATKRTPTMAACRPDPEVDHG